MVHRSSSSLNLWRGCGPQILLFPHFVEWLWSTDHPLPSLPGGVVVHRSSSSLTPWSGCGPQILFPHSLEGLWSTDPLPSLPGVVVVHISSSLTPWRGCGPQILFPHSLEGLWSTDPPLHTCPHRLMFPAVNTPPWLSSSPSYSVFPVLFVTVKIATVWRPAPVCPNKVICPSVLYTLSASIAQCVHILQHHIDTCHLSVAGSSDHRRRPGRCDKSQSGIHTASVRQCHVTAVT